MARNEGKCDMVMRLHSPSTTTYPENENFAQSVLLLKKRKKGNKNNNKKTHTQIHTSQTLKMKKSNCRTLLLLPP
jgi:hypothetical protein